MDQKGSVGLLQGDDDLWIVTIGGVILYSGFPERFSKMKFHEIARELASDGNLGEPFFKIPIS
jgi:hypothetical protein